MEASKTAQTNFPYIEGCKDPQKKAIFDFSKTEGFQMLISKGIRTKMLRNKYSEYLFQWLCFTSVKNGTCMGFLRSRGQVLESVSKGCFRLTSEY